MRRPMMLYYETPFLNCPTPLLMVKVWDRSSRSKRLHFHIMWIRGNGVLIACGKLLSNRSLILPKFTY